SPRGPETLRPVAYRSPPTRPSTARAWWGRLDRRRRSSPTPRSAARSALRFPALLGLGQQSQAVDVARPHAAKIGLERLQRRPVGAVEAAGPDPPLLDQS